MMSLVEVRDRVVLNLTLAALGTVICLPSVKVIFSQLSIFFLAGLFFSPQFFIIEMNIISLLALIISDYLTT